MNCTLILDDNLFPIPGLFNAAVAHPKITVAAASGRNSTAFTHKVVRLTTTAAMNFKVGSNTVTAAATDHYIPANTPTLVYVGNNTNLAVFGSGDAYITELGE